MGGMMCAAQRQQSCQHATTGEVLWLASVQTTMLHAMNMTASP